MLRKLTQLAGTVCAMGVLASAPVWAAEPAEVKGIDPAEANCKMLQAADFSGIQDAPTQLTQTKWISSAEGPPVYRQVQGYVAPQVGFELRLPNNWNSKFLEVGCGGWCGSINADACGASLRRGYACIASDMGHTGTGEDVLWSNNNLQAAIDFGYRATHAAAVSGKAIAALYYHVSPKRSYFVGCSTGGYQGVTEAQRFPWDFDGIIAGAPDIGESDANMRANWIARVALDSAGAPRLSRHALELVHAAVMDKCDGDDGIKDGVIGNPFGCKVDPKRLVCSSGETNGCLTAAQAEIISKLYAGPTNSKGVSVSTGGFLPGSELLWDNLWPPSGIEQYFRYGIAGYSAGGQWKYTDFDFDRDYKRFGLAAYYDNSNPDLRKFKGAGGKIIIYTGGDDTFDLPGAVTDYYEAVERAMGGRSETQSFARLFVIPGMDHCSGGPGAYAIDYFSYLEAWVERGKPPDRLIGAHARDDYLIAHMKDYGDQKGSLELRLWEAAFELKIPLDPAIPVAFTRPIYPYPLLARYRGTGDPNDAANFVPGDGK